MKTLELRAAAMLAACALSACDATILSPVSSVTPPTTPGGTGGPGTGMPPAAPPCTGVCMGVSSLARVTVAEYTNSITDVFGFAPSAASLPGDGEIGGVFFSNDQNPLAIDDVDLYRQNAEVFADTVVTGMGVLDGLLAPLPACHVREAACAEAFVTTYASRLYRRPLSATELDEYATLYGWAVKPASDAEFVTGGSGTFVDGIRYTLEKLLQSPGFLYRPEIGTPTADPNVVALTSQEMGARLASFLLRSVPDAELAAAIAQDALNTPDQISAQVQRLVNGPQGDRMWKGFAHDWVSTQQIADSPAKTADDAPAHWTDAVATDLELDVEQTFTHLMQTDGTIHTLLTSSGGVVQGDSLEWLVGVTGTPGTWMAQMPNRNGLLSWPGMIIANGHPGFTHAHQRGLWIRGALLCQSVGPPPASLATAIANAQTAEENAPTAETDRARLYNLTETNATCANCHHHTNPIGYGLDEWDDLGRFRTTQTGLDMNQYPIDQSGVLAGRPDGTLTTDVDGAFSNGTELINKLASSSTVAHCMEKQLTRFALQREVADDDQPSLDSAYVGFDAKNRDMRELAVTLTGTDAFRFRRTAPRQ